MIEEGIRSGIAQSSHIYAEANKKYINDYDKNKESSYFVCVDLKILYGRAMCQNQHVDRFKWVKNVSIIDEKFRKDYSNDSDIAFILKVDIEYPKELHYLHSDLLFFRENKK